LYLFNPDLVVNELKTHEEIGSDKDRDVPRAPSLVFVRPNTPELFSSDIEAALSNTPIQSIKSLKRTGEILLRLPRAWVTRINLATAQVEQTPPPAANALDDGLPKPDWPVPKTTLQVEQQTLAVCKALAEYLPIHLAEPVLRHFQGLSALARIAGGLEQQLLDTQAA